MGLEQRIVAISLAIIVVVSVAQALITLNGVCLHTQTSQLSWEALGSWAAAVATLLTAGTALFIASQQTKKVADRDQANRLQNEEDICQIIMTEVERIAWLRNRAHHKFISMKRDLTHHYDQMDIDELHDMVMFKPVIYFSILPNLGVLQPERLDAVTKFYHVNQRDQARFGKWMRELPVNEYPQQPGDALRLFALSAAFIQANEMKLAEVLNRSRPQHFMRAKDAIVRVWPELSSESDEEKWRMLIREFARTRVKPSWSKLGISTTTHTAPFG